MAFNKAKALEEAHKYVSQGKLQHAIKQYLFIIQKDPSDLSLLNTVGDLYVREKNMAEGLKYFHQLADAYVKDGFTVQAIAIYKKITKIEPNSVDPLVKLGDLYRTQQLLREAREQYTAALDSYKKSGKKDKAIETLHRLADLEPENIRLRLNLAEFARSYGLKKEAGDAFIQAAILAERQGDVSAADDALSRAEEFLPDHPKVEINRARHALEQQQPEKTERILLAFPELQKEPAARRLLLASYLAQHKLEAARKLLGETFQGSPEDFAPVAEFVERCVARQDYDQAFQSLRFLAPVMMDRRETGPLLVSLRKISAAAPQHIPTLDLIYEIAEKTADESTIPEALEALGRVCTQAGQLEKAEQCYSKLIVREPQNETYRGLLKQVLEMQGKEYRAPEILPFSDAEIALDAASELESTAAAGLPSTGGETNPTVTEVTATTASAGTEPIAPLHDAPFAEEIDLTHVQAYSSETATGEALLSPQEIPLEFGPGAATLDSGREHDRGEIQGAEAIAPDESQRRATEPAIPPFNGEESREEIEFYLAQGFQEEAERAVRLLEHNYPGNSHVSDLRRRVDAQSEFEWSRKAASSDGENEPVLELPTSFPESDVPAGPDPVSQAGSITQDHKDIEDLAGSLAASLDWPVREISPSQLSSGEPAEGLAGLLDDLQGEEQLPEAGDDEQTHYNLGVAFREMGLHDEAIGEFQKVVKGAAKDHFPANFLQACTLLAASFADKGMPGIAAKWYLRALDTPGLDDEAVLALQYELGVAYQQAGDPKSALEKFTEVYSQNIDYRDVAEKIRILRQ